MAHKDIPCDKHPRVSAHITWRASARGPITLRGYAIDTDSGIRKDYSTERRRTAQSVEEIPSKIQILYNVLCAEVERHERRAAIKSTASQEATSPFERAFAELKASPDPICTDWGPRYTSGRLSYFERHLLPMLIQYGNEEWTAADREALQRKTVEQILMSKRSAGHEATANETAYKNLVAADIIYKRMRDCDPSLPEISLRPRYTGRTAKREQIKSLPRRVRRRLVKSIEKMVDKNPRLAIAMVMMYDGGLRTAEAAAVWIDVIFNSDNLVRVLVCYQVQEGKRVKILKTANAYRTIVLSYWGSTTLHRCLEKLSTDPSDTSNLVCDPRKLSATLRQMLMDAGLTAEYFAAAEQAMREKPDYDGFGRPVFDVCAYILRRDWASRARNICGLTSLEIDCLLGHRIRIPKKMREDFRLVENLTKLSKKLERYVHDPEHSRHPGIVPYKLSHSVDLDLIPYDVVRLHNASSETVEIKLDVEAVLNTEYIEIVAVAGSQLQETIRYIPTHCIRSSEPIIGKSYIEEEEYEER